MRQIHHKISPLPDNRDWEHNFPFYAAHSVKTDELT